MIDMGGQDVTKDKPRAVKLSTDGLPKEYKSLGDSEPIRIRSPNLQVRFLDK